MLKENNGKCYRCQKSIEQKCGGFFEDWLFVEIKDTKTNIDYRFCMDCAKEFVKWVKDERELKLGLQMMKNTKQ